jgi:hypothetical protein
MIVELFFCVVALFWTEIDSFFIFVIIVVDDCHCCYFNRVHVISNLFLHIGGFSLHWNVSDDGAADCNAFLALWRCFCDPIRLYFDCIFWQRDVVVISVYCCFNVTSLIATFVSDHGIAFRLQSGLLWLLFVAVSTLLLLLGFTLVLCCGSVSVHLI